MHLTANPDRPSDPYLTAVACYLWPDAEQIHVGGRQRSGQYVVLPSAAHPRLVLPRRPRRVAAAAVRRFKTTANRWERLRGDMLALTALAGAHNLLPNRISIDPDGRAGIVAHLSQALGRNVHVCLYIGPARAVRKPVLQLIDNRGHTFAFAKFGADEFTDELVRCEHHTVADLNTATWQVLRIPQVLHAGTWDGHPLVVQSALPRGDAPRYGSELLHKAATELAYSRGVRRAKLADSAYVARNIERLAFLGHSRHRTLLRSALDQLVREHGHLTLDFGVSHGDWAPWNMTASKDSRHVLVWDWEKFELDVPVGLDAVHYHVQGYVVFEGANPVDAFRTTLGRAASLLRTDVERARLITALYAVDIASRYLVDREQEAGTTRMGDLYGWLEPVLTMSGATAPDKT